MKNYPTALENEPESQGLTTQIPESLYHYVELLVYLSLAITFFTVLPILLFIFILYAGLTTSILHNKILGSCYPFMTFRTSLPYLKEFVYFSLVLSILINFWHFYTFFPNFKASEIGNWESIFGSKIQEFLMNSSEYFEDNKFWVILAAEHAVLIFWGWVGIFAFNSYRNKRKNIDSGFEKVFEIGGNNSESEGFIGSLQK